MTIPRLTSRPFIDRRRLLAAGAALAIPGPVNAQGAGPARAAPGTAAAIGGRPVEITARAIESFQKFSSEKRFGRLEFRGGLVLTSTDHDVGGISGLVMEPDGRGLLAVIDAGAWLTANLTYAGTAPTGISDARIGAIVAQNSRALTRRRDMDAEAVALLDGTLARGTVLVAFERNHRIGRFAVVNREVQAPSGYLKMPSEIVSRRVSSNKGFEAMTVLAHGPYKGAVVAFSERFLSPAGHHTGWLWLNGEPQRLHVTDVNEFDLTDCVGLPDGSLLLLERRFRWTEGVKMQLRLIRADEIGPGKVATGTMLLAADMTREIDNMEAIGVHRGPRGETILTIVSDDNFNSFLQRTLLLQFALL